MRRVLVFSGIASLGCAGIFAANAESRRRLQCGVASIQGRREYQEDRFVASPDDGVFAVFDGHGGSLTSETASKVFLKVLKDALSRRKGELDEKVWNEAFEVTEANYRLVSAGVSDSNGSKRSEGREGSTACAAMIDRFNVLSVANAGDSRCVVCTKKGAAFAMSVDHKVAWIV
jgi:serine/threonine protein phosphatase PrpC